MEPVAKVSSEHRLTSRIARTLAATLLCGSLFISPVAAHAEPATYDDALDQLNRLSDEYSVLADEQDRTFDELQDVRTKIAETETQIKGVEKEVTACQKELDEKKSVLASQVSADYKQGTISLLSILLSSTSIEDAVSKFYYFGSVSQAEASKIRDVNAARKSLQDRKDELEKLKDEYGKQESDIEELYAQKSAQASEMQAQQAEAAALLQSLTKEEQEQLGDDSSDLVAEAKLVIEAEEEEAAEEAEEATEQPADEQPSEQKEEAQSAEKQDKQADQASTSDESASKPKEKKQKKQQETPAQEEPQQQEETKPKKKKESSSSVGTAQILLDAAYSTSGSEALNNGWGCAGWIYTVFRNSGLYNKKPSCAAWYYNNWCYSSDRSELQPGMVIAVSTWTGTAAGKIYGHVGLYVGNNTVRHLSAGAVREISVDKWIRTYGTTVTPRWGWNGGIALS